MRRLAILLALFFIGCGGPDWVEDPYAYDDPDIHYTVDAGIDDAGAPEEVADAGSELDRLRAECMEQCTGGGYWYEHFCDPDKDWVADCCVNWCHSR